jgi:hypothetical protein
MIFCCGGTTTSNTDVSVFSCYEAYNKKFITLDDAYTLKSSIQFRISQVLRVALFFPCYIDRRRSRSADPIWQVLRRSNNRTCTVERDKGGTGNRQYGVLFLTGVSANFGDARCNSSTAALTFGSRTFPKVHPLLLALSFNSSLL